MIRVPHSCPACRRSFVGTEIPREYVQEGLYPATCECGEPSHWSNVMSIYSMEDDRTVAWQCPFCSHEWERV